MMIQHLEAFGAMLRFSSFDFLFFLDFSSHSCTEYTRNNVTKSWGDDDDDDSTLTLDNT